MTSLSDILSVAIGITFIFLILSLLNTWVQEFIATIFSMRAKNLADILQNMLDPTAQKLDGTRKLEEAWSKGPLGDAASKLSQNALKAVYEHPIMYSLSKPRSLPSYIPPEAFTVALFDLLNKAGTEDPTQVEITMENIHKGIEKIDVEPLKDRLLSLVDSTQILENKVEVGIADFRKSVEGWFDAAMDRGKGWYKRRIQLVGIITGILVAVVVNADTISLSLTLWESAVLRQSVSEAAVVYVQKGDQASARAAQEQLASLGLPIGWSFHQADLDPNTPDDPRDFPATPAGWVVKVLGLLITGFAISQGSPIWFDLLNRLVSIRGSGAKPTEPAAEQPKPTQPAAEQPKPAG
jgi:hypothetical protein